MARWPKKDEPAPDAIVEAVADVTLTPDQYNELIRTKARMTALEKREAEREAEEAERVAKEAEIDAKLSRIFVHEKPNAEIVLGRTEEKYQDHRGKWHRRWKGRTTLFFSNFRSIGAGLSRDSRRLLTDEDIADVRRLPLYGVEITSVADLKLTRAKGGHNWEAFVQRLLTGSAIRGERPRLTQTDIEDWLHCKGLPPQPAERPEAVLAVAG